MESETRGAMPYFFMKLVPPRPTFPGDATPQELEVMARHARHIRALIARGIVHAAGPVTDATGTWGLALVEAESRVSAAALGQQDPVIRAGLGFRWEVYPMTSLVLPDGEA